MGSATKSSVNAAKNVKVPPQKVPKVPPKVPKVQPKVPPTGVPVHMPGGSHGAGEHHFTWHELETEIEEAIENFSPAFYVPAIISVVLLLLFFVRRYLRYSVTCPSKNRLDGKTVLITGATSGIGKATAIELARRGGRIILACRDAHRGDALARQIKRKTKNANIFSYGGVDLACLRSVAEFAEQFDRREPNLHILINNAAYLGPKAMTADHYEKSLAVNHLSHFYLSYLLKDKLKKCAPSRIINVVSDAYMKGELNTEDLAMKHYDIYKAYARSKLAQLVFNIEAQRRWSSDVILSFAVHPGCVSTNLNREWPGMQGNMLRAFARVFFKSPDQGCQTIVFCAVADKLRHHSGKLFENCNVINVNKFVTDKKLGASLWDVSLHLVGLDDERQTHDDEEDFRRMRMRKRSIWDMGLELFGVGDQERPKPLIPEPKLPSTQEQDE